MNKTSENLYLFELDAPTPPWHAMESDAVFAKLHSGPGGLSDDEARRRLDMVGPNTLPHRKPPSGLSIFISQFKNPLIFILLAAAIASIAIGEVVDALFILAVVLFNSILGAYQEYNAEQSASSLQTLLKIRAKVLRDGQVHEIPSEELVPGDIVLLETGHKTPADLRLFEERNLTVDESFLTGESEVVSKNAKLVSENVGLTERTNMAFAGSNVISGRAKGVVVATALQTQVGQIAESVMESESAKPPLVLRMEKFTTQISIVIIGVSLLLAALLFFVRGETLTEVFFIVVALAVSATPEGLPVALTVALSIATRRMSKRNVIVRRLAAVESLGSCTVIASDKTGTLTVNQQTAKLIKLPDGKVFEVSGEGYNGEGEVREPNSKHISDRSWNRLWKLSKMAMLANEGVLVKKPDSGWEYSGDAMDVAFLALGYKMGLDVPEITGSLRPLLAIPYESDNGYAALFYEREGERRIAAKGALEVILGFCDSMMMEAGPEPIDPERIAQLANEMAARGLRVLAVAGNPLPKTLSDDQLGTQALKRLTLQGLVGFIDPLRAEAADAVHTCKKAGIDVLMITGDHPETAAAISRELGLIRAGESVATGALLTEAGGPDDAEFHRIVGAHKVFARVSPIQKLQIVDTLIQDGQFVAVTGDGVNDAPALRRANIGVAMGSGTDVAKEVGNMIVVDDNFSSIVSGVEEGRFAYDNVRKVIYLLISCGLAEVLMFVTAILMGLPAPFTAVQLLWLNLVTNGIQDVTLAFEGGEQDAMERPPRKPNEKIFNPLMINQTLLSGFVMGGVALFAWYWFLEVEGRDVQSARNLLLLIFVFIQNVHALNCRSEYHSVFRVPVSRNYLLIIGILVAQGIHIISMQAPIMQRILQTNPISLFDWMEMAIFALPILLTMEAFKWIRSWRHA